MSGLRKITKENQDWHLWDRPLPLFGGPFLLRNFRRQDPGTANTLLEIYATQYWRLPWPWNYARVAAAVLIGLLRLPGQMAVVTFHLGDEPPYNRRTLVFEKREGRWLIVHLHASRPPGG